MASMESLEDLLQEEVKDLYDAEKQLTKALPKLMKKATADALKEALEAHLHETEQHVERLEQVFEQLEMPARGRKCTGMQNLIAEGNEMIDEAEDDAIRDAVMIAAAQKVEHYEIASYGTVRTWASLLGKTDVAELLEETLEEEKAADQKLTSIAESFVNEAAAEGEDEEQEAQPPSSGRRRAPAGRSPRASRAMAADRGRTKSSRSR
jgi:ferritin-like metal-binding protein YciE